MPTYDYRCTLCDERFEVTRPIGAGRDERCPSCDSPAKRVFTPVGVHFKGTGFHNTDYRPKATEKSSDKPAECPAKKDAGSDACASCPAASS